MAGPGKNDIVRGTPPRNTMTAALLAAGIKRPTKGNLGAAVVRTADGKFGPAFNRKPASPSAEAK